VELQVSLEVLPRNQHERGRRGGEGTEVGVSGWVSHGPGPGLRWVGACGGVAPGPI